jgi:outer membrane protein assembly factor BamA
MNLFSQDSTKSYKTRFNGYPYAYYTPETELAFGVGGVITYYTKKDPQLNPSNLTLSGFYSTVKTYEINLNSTLFLARNKMASVIKLNFAHTVDKFFGVGNNTPELGNETYVIDNYGGIADFQIPTSLVLADRGGIVFEYRQYDLVDKKDNPNLQNPFLPGTEGGAISGLGFVYVWDTRDNVFFPNSGGINELKAIFYTKDLGSDYTYSLLLANVRKYWNFGKDKVLAVQAYLESTSGRPPFYKLPALGGSYVMRGYYLGRYRDNNYLAFQVEYRQYFWWRFGFVAFAGFGDVEDEITRFSLTNLKETYGFGLRFLFNEEEKINLRMDIGFGENTNGIYFGMEEAF